MDREPISADGLVPAGREQVFAFLADLANHWDLADRWVEVVSLTPAHDGGRVRVHGPLGLARTIDTQVDHVEPPARIAGTATLGRTRAEVRWELHQEGGGTRVHLVATVIAAGPLDRLLLAAGGRAWLRRRFTMTLSRLAGYSWSRSSRLSTLPVALRGSSSMKTTSRGTL
jgi:Polyketide cyclase / dehydrase and lipid transport